MHFDTINITGTIKNIIKEISIFSPNFAYINTDKVLICISSNKKGNGGATYGKLVPLRFEGGNAAVKYNNHFYSMPTIKSEGIEQFYIIYFFIPRFFDLTFEEKIKIIFHELYHISPDFNGDIRRVSKGKSAHGHSKKHFDSLFIDDLIQFSSYIKKTPYIHFLNMNTKSLYKQFSKVIGRRMKMPKPIVSHTPLFD